jgi:hypothetical protein
MAHLHIQLDARAEGNDGLEQIRCAHAFAQNEQRYDARRRGRSISRSSDHLMVEVPAAGRCSRTTAATKARHGMRLGPCRSPEAGTGVGRAESPAAYAELAQPLPRWHFGVLSRSTIPRDRNVATGIVRLSEGGASKALARGQTYARLLMGDCERRSSLRRSRSGRADAELARWRVRRQHGRRRLVLVAHAAAAGLA